MIDISMLGDKKLQRQLSKLPARVEKRIVRKALRAAARPVLRAAKQKCPVDTGALKKGLKIRARKRSRKSFGVDVSTPTREKLGIASDSKWYYPALVEYGYVRKGITYAARSFLRSAKDATRSAALAILKREIGAGVIREARKS